MSSKVIDLGKARDAKIEDKRRRYERIIFKHILGVYCVSEGKGLKAVELIDVSEEGLSFQLPVGSKNLDDINLNSEKVFRFYFSQETFLPVNVKIQNSRECIESGQKYVRFGCLIDQSVQSYSTFKLFVQFLTKYSETSQKDTGELKFFYF